MPSLPLDSKFSPNNLTSHAAGGHTTDSNWPPSATTWRSMFHSRQFMRQQPPVPGITTNSNCEA
eukprot:4011303-Amphidinium_carterae.4